MKRKYVLKVMGLVIAGSLVLSEAAPVSVRAASAAAQSSQEQEGQAQDNLETAIVCYIDTKNGNDKNTGATPDDPVKTLKEAVKRYQEAVSAARTETEGTAGTKSAASGKGADSTDAQTEGYFVFCGMTESELEKYLDAEEKALKKGETLLPQGTEAVAEEAYESLLEETAAEPTTTPVPGSVPSPDKDESAAAPTPGTTPAPDNAESEDTENPDGEAGKDTEEDSEFIDGSGQDDSAGDPDVTPTPTDRPDNNPTATPAPTDTPDNEPTAIPTPTDTPDNEPTVTPTPTDTPDSTPTVTPVPGEGTEDNTSDTSDNGEENASDMAGQEENTPAGPEDEEDPEEGSADPEIPGTTDPWDGQQEDSENSSDDGTEDSLLDGHLKPQENTPDGNELSNDSLKSDNIMMMNPTALLRPAENTEETDVQPEDGEDEAGNETEDPADEETWSEEEQRLLAGAADSAPSAVAMAGAAEDLGIMLVKAPGTVIVGPDNYDKKPSSSQQGNAQNSAPAATAAPTATKSPASTETSSGNRNTGSSGIPQKKTDTTSSIKTYPVQTGDTAMILPFSISTVLSGLVVAMLSAFHIQSKRREKDLAWQRFREENPLNGEKK